MRLRRSTSAARLRHLPVRLGDHVIAWSSDLVFDADCRHLAGFVVEALSERSYFLPFTAAQIDARGLRVESSLHLVDDVEFYAGGGLALSAPIGLPALVGGREAGPVADVELDPDDGSVLGFLLEGQGRVPRAAARLGGRVLRVRATHI